MALVPFGRGKRGPRPTSDDRSMNMPTNLKAGEVHDQRETAHGSAPTPVTPPDAMDRSTFTSGAPVRQGKPVKV